MTVQQAVPLLYLAHKYSTKPLAEKCSQFMETGITLENAVEVYQIANVLEQENLKEQALQFMLM